MLAFTGYRGADLSCTLFRLHYNGGVAQGTVTDRQVCCGSPTRYVIRYVFLGVEGRCPASVDTYRCTHIGSKLAVRYDRGNPRRSCIETDESTLFWGALFFDGLFYLLAASAIWLIPRPDALAGFDKAIGEHQPRDAKLRAEAS